MPDSPEMWFGGGLVFLKLVKQEFPEGSQSAGNYEEPAVPLLGCFTSTEAVHSRAGMGGATWAAAHGQ